MFGLQPLERSSKAPLKRILWTPVQVGSGQRNIQHVDGDVERAARQVAPRNRTTQECLYRREEVVEAQAPSRADVENTGVPTCRAARQKASATSRT